jgi:phosphoribosyl-ATP pyrophosphohydrolase
MRASAGIRHLRNLIGSQKAGLVDEVSDFAFIVLVAMEADSFPQQAIQDVATRND